MRPTLLIVEGETLLCTLYQKFLPELGYEVETACDGLECLEKLRQCKPSVLVLDLEVRWGGAQGVLAWLREEGQALGIPVVLTAAAGADAEHIQIKAPPVVKVLSKPFTLTALLQIVRDVINTRPETLWTHKIDSVNSFG